MRNKWLWIAVIVLFILMAPVTAMSMVHSLILFVQGVLSGFHLH